MFSRKLPKNLYPIFHPIFTWNKIHLIFLGKIWEIKGQCNSSNLYPKNVTPYTIYPKTSIPLKICLSGAALSQCNELTSATLLNYALVCFRIAFIFVLLPYILFSMPKISKIKSSAGLFYKKTWYLGGPRPYLPGDFFFYQTFNTVLYLTNLTHIHNI